MNRLRHISIKWKLMLVIVFTSSMVLLLSSMALVAYGLHQFRKGEERDIALLAHVIGTASAQGMEEADLDTIHETVNSLRTNPDIISAFIFGADDKLLVHYLRNPDETPVVPAAPRHHGHQFTQDSLVVQRLVVHDGKVLGSVYLRADMAERYRRLKAYGIIIAVMLPLSALVAFLLASRLQRLISSPILELAATMRRVGSNKDYSLRVKPRGGDEVGALYDGFNRMLEQIQIQKEALQTSEARLRAILDNSTAIISLKDAQGRYLLANRLFTEKLCVAAGQIEGRTDADLFSKEQAELLCANDLEVLRTSAPVQYEESIAMEDGDRTYLSTKFPLCGPNGHAYAVGYFATDITERRLLEKQNIEVRDRERCSIGQDLHDGLCQYLVAASISSNLLVDKLDEKSLPEVADARSINSMIEEAIIQSRNVARGLYPATLEAEGLSAALHELASSTGSRFKIVCAAHCVESDHIDLLTAGHLYRIAQEAINNAIKHGKARRVSIDLETEADCINLRVTHDGRSIPETQQINKGMGLRILNYRAHVIGAVLRIGQGAKGETVVSCQLPGNFSVAATA